MNPVNVEAELNKNMVQRAIMQSVAQWYVLRSKPQKERVLYQQVRSHNIECFFPRITVKPVNPRSAKVRPYFPGYMFVNVDLNEQGISTFKWMPFTQGLVSFDDQPAPVPDAMIAALKKRIPEINANGGLRFDALQPGIPVKVVDGPFSGYEGLFDHRIAGHERVQILLHMLNNQHIPLELDVGQIKLK